jgi:hypothetical protein
MICDNFNCPTIFLPINVNAIVCHAYRAGIDGLKTLGDVIWLRAEYNLRGNLMMREQYFGF